jgi:hypothetical protein
MKLPPASIVLMLFSASVALAQVAEGPAASASQPATTQAVSDEAEVRKVLAAVLPEVEIRRLPVLEAFDRLRELSSLNIYVDVKALRSLGMTSSARVSYKKSNITLAGALGEILEPQGNSVTFDVMGKSVVISTKSNIHDLLLQYRTDKYKLTEPEAAKVLSKPVEELNFERTPLRGVIEKLGAAVALEITVDWDSLSVVGVSRDTPIYLKIKNVPLGQVVRLLLHEASGTAALDFAVDNGKLSIFAPPPQ